MKTHAYFENIQAEIIEVLQTATHSVKIAVAWFTDFELFDILLSKAQNGVEIELLLANSFINHDSSIDYDKIKRYGGKVSFIGKDTEKAPLMHNKFCIIDDKILVFGSYNWTRKAQSNHESITIIEGIKELISDFNAEFEKIRGKPQSNALDWGKLLIRLETLLNVIRLEDEDDIGHQVKKIRGLLSAAESEEIEVILGLIAKQKYQESVIQLNKLLHGLRQLTTWQDPEIPALQLEIRSLEWQLSSLEDEKTDIEKQIRNFEIRHTTELGELIISILLLKKQLASSENNQTKAEEAQKDYEDYHQNYEETKAKKIHELNEVEQKELKANFRQASKMCHPDKVPDEQKAMAESVFIDLKNAYESNDLAAVNRILQNLQQNIFVSNSKLLNQKEKLVAHLATLFYKRQQVEETLIELKSSTIFQEIIKINDLDDYFLEKKNALENVKKGLESLKVSQL
jgi:PLD-like domain